MTAWQANGQEIFDWVHVSEKLQSFFTSATFEQTSQSYFMWPSCRAPSWSVSQRWTSPTGFIEPVPRCSTVRAFVHTVERRSAKRKRSPLPRPIQRQLCLSTTAPARPAPQRAKQTPPLEGMCQLLNYMNLSNKQFLHQAVYNIILLDFFFLVWTEFSVQIQPFSCLFATNPSRKCSWIICRMSF